MRKLLQRLVIGVAVGAGLYAAATIWLGARELAHSLGAFNYAYLIPVLLLTLTNYGLRYLKWSVYLRAVEISLPRSRNLLIFVSGLSMTVTPGKVGELLKSYLLRTSHGVPMTRSAPVVLAERVTDLIALVILMGVGFISFRRGALLIVLVAAALLMLLAALSSQRLASALIHLVTGPRPLRRARANLLSLYAATAMLFRPRPLAIASTLSLVAWFCECLGTYLVVRGFPGQQISPLLATFVYSATTLGGLPTPGGLGLTDGGMAALLRYLGGVATTAAAASTLLVRLSTLWFAVLVGVIALLIFRRHVGLADDAIDELRQGMIDSSQRMTLATQPAPVGCFRWR